jgi:Flp pilus assembly protein TadG
MYKNRRGIGQWVRGQRGAAAVEFALVLPILLVILLGIIDFGLYFYNDLQLTHVARDAARYLSVGLVDEAEDVVANAHVTGNVTITGSSVEPSGTGDPSTVTLEADYSFITPLPNLVGIESPLGISASVVMRRE